MSSRRTIFVGATRNYFKVGHATIDYLAEFHPDVKLRLAIPEIHGARETCRGKNVELVEWNPDQPKTLSGVFENCDSALLVPPVKDRIKFAQLYLEACAQSGVKFVVCIGVQHTKNGSLALSRESDQVEEMLKDAKIPYSILHLPLFLENLLYQLESIRDNGIISFPCKPDSKFSYVACKDLGPIIGEMLKFHVPHTNTKWTAAEQISCTELAQHFSVVLKKNVSFVPIKGEDFIQKLTMDGGSAASKNAAQGILELWNEIDAGRDLPSTDLLEKLLRKKPITAQDWILEHVCCFSGRQCEHPHPPCLK